MISRRRFLRDVSVAGGAGLLGLGADVFASEPPPENRRIRIPRVENVCWAPVYVAGDLLKAEGFSEVQFVRYADPAKAYVGMAAGEIDIFMAFVAPTIQQIDAGNPLVVLGGVHPGCLELFASSRIRSVQDLKGKTIASAAPNDPGHLFTAAFLGHVGVDPQRDVKWIYANAAERLALLSAGKIDAVLSGPPGAQEMRAKRIGHVIVNTTTDRPWSQYFCCVVTANRDFIRKHPVATKRAMRAILKASHVCASDPEPIARQLVKDGFTPNFDYAYQALRETPYGRWRDYDAEDTMRYYALRLKEAGFIRSSPKKIIADGSDWRFLNELKKELKA
jgi:NitT/TauT family transport system substrate-binding protein